MSTSSRQFERQAASSPVSKSQAVCLDSALLSLLPDVPLLYGFWKQTQMTQGTAAGAVFIQSFSCATFMVLPQDQELIT
jgi:hypothetical protein